MTEIKNVGYIGLGNIGGPSAERLIQEPYRVHVFDLYEPAMQALKAAGAHCARSAAELASQCAHIGICVRDDEQVAALLYGEAGIFAHAAPGTMIAIHSTVTQNSILEWAEQASQHQLRLIDAPITGGAHRARDGTLCYMVGGEEADVTAASPVFLTSGEKVVHAGPLGSGIALKLCNNYIQYAEFVAMAEATRMAEACGLSADVLRDVGRSNGVVNEQMHLFVSARNSLAASASEEDMQQFFGAMGALGRKDLDCALATAADRGVVMPTAEFVRDRIEAVFLARDESRPAN